jgi:DNA-binding NarL/FixJ family response regulator
MDELRHLLGLLTMRSGPDDAPLHPQPGLDQLPALVAKVRAGGQPVAVEHVAVDLPWGADLAAYRVVREASTNALRHAPGAPTTVVVRPDAGALLIDVADEGGTDGPTGSGTGTSTGTGTGSGLRGLTERVALYGGHARRPAALWRRVPRPGPHPVAASPPGPPGPPVGRPVTSTTGVLRVVVADDQALVRSGFAMILTAAGIEVVAQAADGAEAVAAVRRSCPDVVLLEVRMPVMDGLEATRRILADPPTTPAGASTRVIILTTFDLDRYVYAALTAGATGFLLEDVAPDHLVHAVRLARQGDALLAPAITRRLVERFAPPLDPDGSRLHRDLAALTTREREVLTLLAAGRSNAEPAAALHVGEATVKTHVTRILTKLHLVTPGRGPQGQR